MTAMTTPTSDSAQGKSTRSTTPKQAESVVGFHHILSDDGTRLRAWTNDPMGRIDGPTVVLCNGLGVSPWTWPALLHADCGVRVVSWNHRGTGGSARPEDPLRVGIEEFVEDALSVMDHFGVDRAVVMGWSMGVNTAFELTLRHPERVTGIFAVAGVPGDTFATMLGPLRLPHGVARNLTVSLSRLMLAAGRAISPVTTRLPVGARTVAALTHSGFMLPTPDNELTARAVREFLSIPVEWYFHLALRTSEHARVSLRRVKVPVMLVAATYDVLAGARDMRTAADRLEDATYIELRASHFVQMERPDEVHDLLLSFLDEIAG
jgi:pimeloyl-ACP methyl ester carboxylesterase